VQFGHVRRSARQSSRLNVAVVRLSRDNYSTLNKGCLPVSLFFPSFSFSIPFINAIRPFYGCQRNARKILPLLCRLGLMLRLGSV